MAENFDHATCVDVWIDRRVKGLPPERLVQVFEDGFERLWRRANLTLGEVTLVAIVDRVLVDASDQFPELSSLSVDSTGLRWQDLRGSADCLPRQELVLQLRYVMTEFLRVLGNLTAEILTPALHAELCPPATPAIETAGSRPAKR